jgi:uncharacterized protein (DUF2237 family)
MKKQSGLETPVYCAYQHWQNGVPTMVPVRYVPGEAWALVAGKWIEIDSLDVGMYARMLDAATFKSVFARDLIALPATAFQKLTFVS